MSEPDATGARAGKRVAETFEELRMYQAARELTNEVYRHSRQPAFAKDHGLVDQIRRAAVSVMSNIAEGYERGSKAEFVQFLYIAKGSCGGVRAQLQVAGDQAYLSAADSERLQALAKSTSRMIAAFIARQQQSSYQGAKATGPRRQAVAETEQRQAALRAAQEVNIRAREAAERQRKATDGGAE